MNSNKENPSVGKKFQSLTAELLSKHFDKDFISEIAINIGNPLKAHKFDLVSKDNTVVVECKCYTWTEGQNNPSAKMATLNEAVLYFKLLPDSWKKVIAMKKSVHPRRSKTLADYYKRRYEFVLDGITIIEIDVDTQTVKIIKE
jgi:hypothetical protein